MTNSFLISGDPVTVLSALLSKLLIAAILLSTPWIFLWVELLLLRGSHVLWRTAQMCMSLRYLKSLFQVNPFIRINARFS